MTLAFDHLSNVVSERVLPNKELPAQEQKSLQGALVLASNNAEVLRAVVTTYIANAQANGCKLNIQYPKNDLIYRRRCKGMLLAFV